MKGHGLRSNGLVTEMSGIVGYPATVQTLKGIISGGPVTTVRYSLDKLGQVVERLNPNLEIMINNTIPRFG
jgi:hypothetical protein